VANFSIYQTFRTMKLSKQEIRFGVFFSHLLSLLYNKSPGSLSNATNYLTFSNSQKNILSFINFLKLTYFCGIAAANCK